MPSTTFKLEKSIIIKAGAGAGKTTTLTQWFNRLSYDFKAQNNRFPRVVICTFTKKATQEIKERLISSANHLGHQELAHYICEKNNVQISTIHGVLSLFLSQFYNYIGFGNKVTIVDDTEKFRILKGLIFNEIDQNKALLDLLKEYNFNFLHENIYKLINLISIEDNLSAISIDDQKVIYKNEVDKIKQDIEHLICEANKQLKDLKWSESLMILDNILKFNDYKQLHEQLNNFKFPRFMKNNEPFSSEIKDEIDIKLSELLKIFENYSYFDDAMEKISSNSKKLLDVARSIFELYKIKMQSEQLITMGELESLSLNIINQFPNTAFEFSQQWDYWMIDEYQDTSPIQVKLLHSLIGDKSKFIVGDPQQSIYLFRGARSEVFKNEWTLFENRNFQNILMMNNYRTLDKSLNFINDLFTSVSSQFSKMDAQKNNLDFENYPESLVNNPLRLIYSEDKQLSEIEMVYFEINQLISKGIKPESICVLSRKNSLLENFSEFAFQKKLPVQLHANNSFFQRAEVIEALSLLKVLVNPHDNLNLLIWLRTPWMGWSDQKIYDLCQNTNEQIWNSILEMSDNDSKIEKLKYFQNISYQVGIINSFIEAIYFFKMFEYSYAVDPSGRREANLWKLISWLSEEERKPNFDVLKLIRNQEFEVNIETSQGESDASPVIEPNRVQLMTVHASKGLQFDSIIILGMGDAPQLSKVEPLTYDEESRKYSISIVSESDDNMNSNSILSIKTRKKLNFRELEESERVFYVALTRTKLSISFIKPQKYSKNSWYDLMNKTKIIESYEKLKILEIINLNHDLVSDNYETRIFPSDIKAKWKSSYEAEQFDQSVSVTELINPFGNISYHSTKIQDQVMNIHKAVKGTYIHKMFESLKYMSIDDVKLKWNDKESLFALDYCINLKIFNFLNIIANGEVEMKFLFKENSQIIQGQIDLWGRDASGVWIIDFKTGSSAANSKAYEQLKIYKTALIKMNCINENEPIKLMALYPLEQKYFIYNKV